VNDKSELASLENLKLYLERLHALRQRWQKLDPSDMLGLALAIDDGVKRFDARFASLLGDLSMSQKLAALGELRDLLGEAKTVAISRSLQERIQATVSRLELIHEHVCHFCRMRSMLSGARMSPFTCQTTTLLRPCGTFRGLLGRGGSSQSRMLTWAWRG